MSTESAPKRRVTFARPRAAIDKLQKVLAAHDALDVLGPQGVKDFEQAIKLIQKHLPIIEVHEATKKAADAKKAAEKRIPSQDEIRQMKAADLKELASSKSIEVKGNAQKSLAEQIIQVLHPVEKQAEPAVPAEKKAPKKAAA